MAEALLEIHSQRLGTETEMIAVTGQIDLYAAPELKVAVGDAIRHGARRLILDMSETSFIDSSALSILLGAVKRLRPLGGEVVVISGRGSAVREVFEITGLDHLFELRESAEELTDAT